MWIAWGPFFVLIMVVAFFLRKVLKPMGDAVRLDELNQTRQGEE